MSSMSSDEESSLSSYEESSLSSDEYSNMTDDDKPPEEIEVDTSNCAARAAALPANSHPRLTIRVDFPRGEEEVGVTEDWETFCQAAGNLTSLEWVSFNVCGFLDQSINDQGRSASENHFVRMQRLLDLTRQIKVLSFDDRFRVPPVGGEEGIICNPFLHYLARGIENHPALEKLNLPRLKSNEVDSLERFMPTLSTIPNLKELSIEFVTRGVPAMADDDGSVGASFLRQLLTLPSLENLYMSSFQFRDEYSNVIEQALSQQTSRLRKLELYTYNMTMECFASLVRGMSGRHSNLQVFRLLSSRIIDYDSSRAAHLLDPLSGKSSLKELAIGLEFEEEEGIELPSFNFLQTNKTVRILTIFLRLLPDYKLLKTGTSFVSLYESLWKNCSLNALMIEDANLDDDIGALAEMIRGNKGVRRLYLTCHRFSSQHLLEFAPALAQNTTLKTLHHRMESEVTSEDMEKLVAIMAKNFHLEKWSIGNLVAENLEKGLNVICKLNKFGRSYLVEDGRGPECRVAGVELLSAVSDDLDCLFYHLRENPTLCDLEIDAETASGTNVSGGGLQGRFFDCCCWRRY